jgi:hypothetical protein
LVGSRKMNTIRSVVKNGRVEVNAPPDWPDGTPVRVELGLSDESEYDDESPETPEEIQAWLRWNHGLEPIVMTADEEAAWEADRSIQKEFDVANAAERDRRIEGISGFCRNYRDLAPILCHGRAL